jgi:phosphohistidine phosphatase SixA
LIIYLLRHAQAQPKASFAGDEERMLTMEGAAQVRKVLSIAKFTFGVEVDRILSSPYKRALETARIAKEILKPKKPKIFSDEALTPDKSPYELYEFLSKQKFEARYRVLVVSHQPIIDEVISDLIGSRANISFAPGSMARVDIGDEIQAKRGTLIWLISSDAL